MKTISLRFGGLIVVFALPFCFCNAEDDALPHRLTVKIEAELGGNTTAFVPMLGLRKEHNVPNRDIQHLFIAIHGAGSNPRHVLKASQKFLEKLDSVGAMKSRLICPQFFFFEGGEQLGKSAPIIPGLITWQNNIWAWGSSLSAVSTHTGNVINAELSAMDVLDQVLMMYAEKESYPNLEKITLIGFSAGGQLIQRYALASAIEDVLRSDLSVRYIVAAPSSYMYLDGERPVTSSLQEGVTFEIPETENNHYHAFGYGLTGENFWYFRRQEKTVSKTSEDFAAKRVLFLVGSNDTESKFLDVRPAAMLQGANRRERAEMFKKYLVHFYEGKPGQSESSAENHQLQVISGAGHSLEELLTVGWQNVSEFVNAP